MLAGFNLKYKMNSKYYYKLLDSKYYYKLRWKNKKSSPLILYYVFKKIIPQVVKVMKYIEDKTIYFSRIAISYILLNFEFT